MMKTKLYNLIAWTACIMMASCTNQEIIEEVTKPVHSNTLNVMTEKQESRSVLSYEGTFYWTENDYIGVYGEETENARFHFTSQADGVSVFTGNMNASGETVKWAYFPYSEEVDVDKNQLSFPMPAERTISNENHSPMIGRIEANNTVRFYHTGGILLLKIVGLPKQASQLVITSEGENSPCLAGTAVIDDTNVDGCTYRIENGSKEVVYDVRNLEGDGYVYSIYMPLQMGTYEKVKVTLKNEVGGVIKERSLSNLIVTRGKMTETPTLNFSDKTYGYELPEECFKNTEWDEGYLFSNELFVASQFEDLKGKNYVFYNLYSTERYDPIHIQLDENGEVANLQIGMCLFNFYNYTDNHVDVTVYCNGQFKEYLNQPLSKKSNGSRAGVEGGVATDLVTAYNYITIVKNFLKPDEDWVKALGEKEARKLTNGINLIDYDLGKVVGTIEHDGLNLITGVVASAATGAIAGAIVGAAAGGVGAVPGAIAGATSAAVTTLVTSLLELCDKYAHEMLYNICCGNAQIQTIEPTKIDVSFFNTGYILSNTESVKLKQHQKCGLLVKKVANWRTFSDTPRLKYNGLNVDHYNVQSIEEAEHKSNYPIFNQEIHYESGYTYYIRAFIAVGWKGNPTCYYSDMKKISFDDAAIDKASVTSVKYQNGKMHISFNVKGKCFDDSDYNMVLTYEPIYSSSNLRLSKKWNKKNNNVDFKVELDRKYFIYSDKDTDGCFKVSCTRDESSEIIDFTYVFPKYNVEPSVDLDVEIIDGPRKVGGSRAADDEEEKYYIKYKVTAKTEGSGWIKQVNIKVDGRSVKTGNPKNEGESFTYIGSKTYKNKSELPTISCEGILINGAGNIQSSPGSISVASQVP